MLSDEGQRLIDAIRDYIAPYAVPVAGGAIGYLAGNGVQANTYGSSGTIAIGSRAGYKEQGGGAIAIGASAGSTNQGAQSVAIGPNAGATNQGAQAVAIGPNAGDSYQPDNSIIINATGSDQSGVADQTDSFYVKPVRAVSGGAVPDGFYPTYYNPTTGEFIVVRL